MTINMQLIQDESKKWRIVLGDKNVYALDTGPCVSPESAFGEIVKQILIDAREVFFSKYSVEEHEKVKSAKEK